MVDQSWPIKVGACWAWQSIKPTPKCPCRMRVLCEKRVLDLVVETRMQQGILGFVKGNYCGNIFPFAACDDQEFLKLMDKTAPMKVELKQIKSSLNSVSQKQKSLQQSNAKWEVCKSDLITQVAASALELRSTKEELMEMKENEIKCRIQIRDLSMEVTSLRGQFKQRSAMNRGAVATPPAPGPSEDCSPAAWMRDSRRQHGRSRHSWNYNY